MGKNFNVCDKVYLVNFDKELKQFVVDGVQYIIMYCHNENSYDIILDTQYNQKLLVHAELSEDKLDTESIQGYIEYITDEVLFIELLDAQMLVSKLQNLYEFKVNTQPTSNKLYRFNPNGCGIEYFVMASNKENAIGSLINKLTTDGDVNDEFFIDDLIKLITDIELEKCVGRYSLEEYDNNVVIESEIS